MPPPPAQGEAFPPPSGTVTTPPLPTGAPAKVSRPSPRTPTPPPCTPPWLSRTPTTPNPGPTPRASPTGPPGPCTNSTARRRWTPTTGPCSCRPSGPPTCPPSPPTTMMSTSWTPPPPGRGSSPRVMSPRLWLSTWTQVGTDGRTDGLEGRGEGGGGHRKGCQIWSKLDYMRGRRLICDVGSCS